MNILVTGGASGLGEAITRKLAQNSQDKIFFTYFRSQAKAEQICQELSNTEAIACDFTSAESLLRMKNFLQTIDLDVVVNNAVTGLEKKHFHKMDPEVFLSSFKNNVLPIIQINQTAINIFRKKKFGKIITILSSYVLNKPPTGLSEYVATKEYIHALAKSWAAENAAFNITSNCISPSFMLTQLTQDTDERVIEEMQKAHPLKTLLKPEEVAVTVQFLVSASQQINGTNIIMNAAADIV
ncbi:SDR family NAD(P)-dependent oxidoreductase [Rufibacter soli]